MWSASLELASTALTGTEFASVFGEIGALASEAGGRARSGKTTSENVWRIATAPSPDSAERHLDAIRHAAHRPCDELAPDRLCGASLLVTRYGDDGDRPTSRLFVDPSWIVLLARLGGWIDVEHRVTQPGGLPDFVCYPVGKIDL